MSNPPSTHENTTGFLKEMRKNRQPHPLRVGLLIKFSLPFVVLSLVSIFILAANNFYQNRKALTNAANQTLRASAIETATAISAFLDTAKNALQLEASFQAFVQYMTVNPSKRQGSPEEVAAYNSLITLIRRGGVLSYSIFDKSGKVWLSTLVPVSEADTLPPHLEINLADDKYLRQMEVTNQPYVSPAIFLPGKEPSLFIASRINNSSGSNVGVLVAQYSLSRLVYLLTAIEKLAGEGSFAVLFDNNGLRIAEANAPATLYSLVVPLDDASINQLLNSYRLPSQVKYTNFPDLAAGLKNRDKSPYFTSRDVRTGAEVNSAALYPVKDTQWVVAFMQPQSIFLKPIENQTRTTIIWAIVIAFLTSLISALVARIFIQPILHLTRSAELIAGGNLDIQAPVESNDEIGTLAAAFNTMTNQLGQILTGLEKRVQERTAELEKVSTRMTHRAFQLGTVADVARAIATIQDPNLLLPNITNTISERFDFYHVGIFLLDTTRQYAVLRAANSEGGQRMLARGHRLRVGQTGIVGYVADSGQPRLALDVGSDAVFFNNPDLPITRSELALPLRIGSQVIGVLDVQSVKPSAFSSEDITLLSTLADQVAVAIENSRLFRETKSALAEAQTFQREFIRTEWSRLAEQKSQAGFQYLFGEVTPLRDEEIIGPIMTSSPQQGLSIPISLRGEVIGSLQLQDLEKDHIWNKDEISLVQAVADQVGLALENARLLEATQRRAEREVNVGQISTRLRASNDPQTILQTAVTELRQILRAQKAQVIIRTASDQLPTMEHDASS